MNIKYTYNGQSLWSYLHSIGMTVNKTKKIYWRIKNKCMTVEEALNFEPPKAGDRTLQVRMNGRRFRGYSDEEMNMTKEEAIRRGNYMKSKYAFKGKTMKELAKEKGISYNTLYSRITKQGMSVAQALNEEIVHQRHFKFNGKDIKDLFDKTTVKNIYSRVSAGWSLEDACTIPVDSFHNRRAKDKEIKDKIFCSCGYRKLG